MRVFWVGLKPALVVLERMVLAFPLAVVLSATATFWFGGHCAGWQFLLGVAAAFLVAAAQVRLAWRFRVGGMGLFLLFLAGVWVATGCLALNGCDDMGYHMPVTRLLMEGWNPVWASTPETLTEVAGLPLSGMWHWHVLYIAHPVEVFNAVFAGFCREPFNLVFPLTPFLLVPALGMFWRFGRECGWGAWVRGVSTLTLVSLLLGAGWGINGTVDLAVAASGVGTVLAMSLILNGKRAWGALLVFSLWMMVAKQSSLLTCFVFWCLFAGLGFWRFRGAWRGWAVRLAACGLLLAAGLCWICTVPYLTSWARIGHPLYPACTADEARFPTFDITADFHDKNVDAQAMGYVGLLANAYLSPALTRAYYAWRLDRPDFKPWCRVWGADGSDGSTPMPASARGVLLASLALLLAVGGRKMRLPLLFCLVGVVAFPPAYVGYLRYVPWLYLLPAMAAGCCLADFPKRWRPLGWCLGGILVAGGLAKGLFFTAFPIDYAYELKSALREPGLQALCLPERSDYVNAIRLFHRQTPALRELPLVEADVSSPNRRDFGLPSFSAVLKEGAEPPFSYHRAITRLPSRTQRYIRYLLFVPRTYLVALPQVLCWRIGTLWDE